MTNNDNSDIGTLLADAMAESGLSQYELARRLALIRSITRAAAKGTLRRYANLEQTPTRAMARDLAKAFRPDLDLPDTHFYVREAQVGDASARPIARELRALTAALRRLAETLDRMFDQ